MIVAGIDPGMNGAIVVLEQHSEFVEFRYQKLTTDKSLSGSMRLIDVDRIVLACKTPPSYLLLEEVNAFGYSPTQQNRMGARSLFTQGCNFGQIQMMLSAHPFFHSTPVEMIFPGTWMSQASATKLGKDGLQERATSILGVSVPKYAADAALLAILAGTRIGWFSLGSLVSESLLSYDTAEPLYVTTV